MSDSEEDTVGKQLKIVFLGEANVGKTNIVRRFCYDEFTRQYNQTIGAEFYIRRLLLPNKQEVTVRIIDVGGSELHGHMLPNYLFNTNMVILVYDITNSASFDCLTVWIDAIRKIVKNAPISALVGNKCDLEHQRAVRLDRTQDFVQDCDLRNFFISAKTGEGVNTCLIDLIAKHFGIPLTRTEKEHQESVVKVELVPATMEQIQTKITTSKSSVFIEKYTENVRFCIICNYLSKIIPALQSRCTRFRFGPLSPEQILPRLNYVIDEERIKVSEDGKQALLTLANGDMRKVLNVLQSTWLAYKDVTEDNVYSCVGHPLKSDIENIVKWLLNDNFQAAYKNIKELKVIKGLALSDIVTEVHKYVHRIEFPFAILIALLDKLAEIEYCLVSGTNENIQLTALIATFQQAKNLNPSEAS